MINRHLKKVLIITYYWPPGGSAGVQRWLKITKYLRTFGWEPVIYTPSNPEFPVLDPSLEKDVPENITIIKQPIWEPYDLYRKVLRKKKNESVNQGFISREKKPSALEKFSIWIRGNFFIPDARKFWVKPSIEFLSTYLKENPVDAMISNGPPHSMHLIARGLQESLRIPWIADFRDPWTQIDFYDQLMLTKSANNKHKKLELSVLAHADKVTTVTWSWAEGLESLCDRKVEVILNGFDADDFIETQEQMLDGFLFHHIGALNKDRNPHVFWEALKEICETDPAFKRDLKIQLTGNTDYAVIESLKKNKLFDHLILVDYLPHAEVVRLLLRSPVLLLPLNDTPNIAGIVPGKIYEYLAAKRPIFSIGKPDGDTARILHATNAGVIVDFKNKDAMKVEILKLYRQYQSGKLNIDSRQVDQFSRKGSAEKFAKLLNEITAIQK